MDLIIDDDVKAVAEFMQSSMAAAKLVSVAEAVAALAPVLWGKFEPEGIDALRLKSPAINADRVAHKQPSAKQRALGLANAGDGSVAGAF